VSEIKWTRIDWRASGYDEATILTGVASLLEGPPGRHIRPGSVRKPALCGEQFPNTHHDAIRQFPSAYEGIDFCRDCLAVFARESLAAAT